MTGGYSNGPVMVFLPSHEHRWALAGFVLALVLVALLVSVMNENIEQAKVTREAAAMKHQERNRCASMRDRIERDQCLLDVRVGEQAQVASR